MREKGDLEELWEQTYNPAAVAKRAREKARLIAKIEELRAGHGYAAWICSLKSGDEVVLRFPWLDKDVPGGERHPGWVGKVRDDRLWVDYIWFGGDISHRTKRFHLPYGGGDPYCRIEHPTRQVIYSAEHGYIFRDELEPA